MKRSTCKKLIIIGIILLVLSFFLPLLPIIGSFSEVLVVIGIVLLIVAWIKWNSEEKQQRRKEIHKAQLEALKRGKVNVDLKGKMRKLK